MSEQFTMTAKTLFGLEDILVEELSKLGASNIVKGTRMVQFTGNTTLLYKANIACRTAIKILIPIHHFKANNENVLYDAVKKIDWSTWIQPNKTFAIDATIASDYFNHSKYIALKTKDAIVDQCREKFGTRPNIELQSPDIRLHIHIHQDDCTISLDSSGASLHQRGYRKATNIAPINEVLAAGILLLSGWHGQCHFLDPMCGSGTILIEAAMIALNIPANCNRTEFAFERWEDYDNQLFETVLEECMQQRKPFPYSIQGFDIDISSVHKAKNNIENANLSDVISADMNDFFDSQKTQDGELHLLFNPPYDERIGIKTTEFYEDIGNTLKHHYAGTHAWMLTGNLEALKYVGLKPSRKIKVFNGAIEARLLNYEMYAGKKHQ